MVARVRRSTFVENCRRYALLLPEQPASLAKNQEAKGYKVMTVKGHLGQHPLSAAFRKLATARALQRLYERGVRHVYSVFGSDRDKSVVDALNQYVDEQDQMRLQIVGDALVTQDIVRRRSREIFPPPPQEPWSAFCW